MQNNQYIVEWTRQQASSLLKPLGNRWKHTQGVVKQAQKIEKLLKQEERDLLLAAAYVHDIGYAPSLRKTGYHSIDGAYYLRDHRQERLASLVAHHFEAYTVVQQLDLIADLENFPREYSIIADALDYCDLTSDSAGNIVTFQERLDDILRRHPDAHPITYATYEAIPALRKTYERIQQLLDTHELI